MILTSSPFTLVMTFLGVPAGARMPYQVVTSKSGRPASAAVGTSGSAGERCGATTASARSLARLDVRRRRRDADEHEMHVAAQHVLHRQVHALVRDVHQLRPATRLNSSPARWFEVPAPPEPKLSAPGFASPAR
jgi:hypothetical protein